MQGHEAHPQAGDWSAWVPLTFKFNFLVSVHGMTQFYVIRADKELQIYASPVNMDPRNPPIPISKPDDFSAELASKQLGLYRTLGWAESADKPLNEGRLDEAAFLYDSDRAFDDREKIIFKNLESNEDWDLFVAAIETTDRVSAHDVAPHRPQAPDVRRRPGGEIRRRDREGLSTRRRLRRPAPRQGCRGTRSSW